MQAFRAARRLAPPQRLAPAGHAARGIVFCILAALLAHPGAEHPLWQRA